MSITKASLIDLNGQELILDADADTSITADTDDQIDIKIAGSDSIRIKANEIENVSGNLTLDVAGTLILDADGAILEFQDGGTSIGTIESGSQNLNIKTAIADKDIRLQGFDGDLSTLVTALTLDMSEAGAATFNSSVTATKLTSTNGVLELDDNGSHNGIINSPAALYLNIDSDANSSGEALVIAKDRTSTSGGTEILRVNESKEIQIGGTSDAGFIDFDGNKLQLNTQRNPNSGSFVNTGKSHASIILNGSSGGSKLQFYADDGNNTVASEIVTIDSDGLKFNGDTAAANALDDYEESTFNTELVGDSSGTHTTSGSGRLTKIGRLASVLLAVDNVSSSSVSGNLRISLPVAYAGHDMYLPVQVYQLDYPADTKTAYAYVSNGYNYVVLYWSRDNNTSLNITNSHLKSGGGSYIRANFNYPTS